jgi:hypothetical protein
VVEDVAGLARNTTIPEHALTPTDGGARQMDTEDALNLRDAMAMLRERHARLTALAGVLACSPDQVVEAARMLVRERDAEHGFHTEYRLALIRERDALKAERDALMAKVERCRVAFENERGYEGHRVACAMMAILEEA